MEAYRYDLEEYRSFLNARRMPLGSPDSVRAFIAHLFARGLSRSTMGRKVSAIRSLGRYLVREGGLEANQLR